MAHGMNANRHNAHPSSERRYERHITFIDQKPVGVRRLFCAGDDCGQQGEILDRTKDGLPPALIERRFKAKGWEVGKSEKHDYCPACVEKQRTERRQRRNRNAVKVLESVTNVFPLTPRETPLQAKGELEVQATAESVREMSKIERRTVHAKLDDVYEDEVTGYKPGWSDAAVARDLNVPVAWVADERERAFGPVRDNAEVRDMLERVTKAAHEARVFIDECKLVRKDSAAMIERTNLLLAKGTEIGKTLDGLIAIASRIEKAVS
jgi:hypothetical protein